MKRFFCFLSVLMLLFTCASAEPFRVYDNAGLFSEEEEIKIEEKILEFRKENKIDFAVLTTDDFITKDDKDLIPALFYQSMEFGIGKDKDGAVFYIDMNGRYTVLLPQGNLLVNEVLVMDDLLKILDDCTPYFTGGLYADGILQGISALQSCIDNYWEKQLN